MSKSRPGRSFLHHSTAGLSAIALLGLLLPASAVDHPFMVWTREEATVIRQRIETESWAKTQYDALLKEKGNGQTFRNLFRYLVMGDESVFEAERKYLVSLIGNNPREFLGDTGGGRHYDQYLSVLRYDALYDRLSEMERRGLEETFRDFIKHHCEEETLEFTRSSWLPNMQWPRPMTAHLMAVALRDEQLIRQCFNSRGGWKYYFDDYLADGRFYGEEFGKQYSMIGEMFLWCRGVERLGLNELGFGYAGKGGATMQRYVESVVEIGYPRVEIPGGLPHYPQITMGDARGSSVNGAPPYLFQKSIVDGFLPGGTGGNRAWMSANMNGRDHKNAKVDKMLTPHWFELAHTKWPESHFDYFLAQMRNSGDAAYTPSLFWGAAAIDPKKVPPSRCWCGGRRRPRSSPRCMNRSIRTRPGSNPSGGLRKPEKESPWRFRESPAVASTTGCSTRFGTMHAPRSRSRARAGASRSPTAFSSASVGTASKSPATCGAYDCRPRDRASFT